MLEKPGDTSLLRILGQGTLSGSPVYSPDGKFLAVPSSAGVFLYDAQTRDLILSLPTLSYGTHLAISPDSRLLASGSGWDITLWSLPDGKALQSLSLDDNAEILNLTFSKNNEFLAASYYGSKTSVEGWDPFSAGWKLADGKQIFQVQGADVRFSPDSSMFITTTTFDKGDWSTFASYDYNLPANPLDKIFLYSTSTGTVQREWQGQAAEFLTDDQLMVETMGATRVIDPQTDKTSFAFSGRHAAVSRDGKYLVIFDRGELSLYSLENGKFLRRMAKVSQLEDIPIEIMDADGLTFSPEGEILYGAELWAQCSNCTPGGSFTAGWRVSDGSLIKVFQPQNSVWAPRFSPDGNTLLVAQPTRIDFYNPTDGSIFRSLDQFSGPFDSLAFSPDGRTLAAGSGEPVFNVRLWDWQTGQGLSRIKDNAGNSGSWEGDLSFSRDGKVVGYAGFFWQIDSGQRLSKLEDAYRKEYSFIPSSLAFAPNKDQVALGFNSGVLQVWDLSKPSLLGKPQSGYTGNVSSLSYSSDGKLLASVYGYPDYIVQLWQLPDLTKGALIPGKYFSRAAISPDGQTIATLAGKDDLTQIGAVQLWSLSGESLHSLDIHNATRIAYSPDGQILATGSDNGVVRLWDVQAGSLLATLPAQPAGVTGLTFSPNGEALAVCSTAGVVYIWSIK
jgi:WD40 repeat protein